MIYNSKGDWGIETRAIISKIPSFKSFRMKGKELFVAGVLTDPEADDDPHEDCRIDDQHDGNRQKAADAMRHLPIGNTRETDLGEIAATEDK